nr:ribonuclease H-like domain-containing protein [Tanacetum cinerariifolium]
MRIEQYFLMTEYSLWEAIINGDSPVPTVVVEGAVQPAAIFSEDLDQIHNTLQKLVSQLEIHEIDVDDLKEIDLRWQMAMLTMRAKRFLQKTGRNLGDNKVTTMGFDMSKVECYNCHRKGHFARECRSPKDTRKTVAEPQTRHVPSYQAEEEPANFALMAIPSSSSASDNEAIFSESDSKSLSPSCSSDRMQPSGGYNAVPPLITGNFMPPKPDLVFHTASIAVETAYSAFIVQLSSSEPAQDLSPTTRPMAPIIEDWPTEHVKPSRHSKKPVEAPILDATPKPTSSKTNGSSKRKNRKTCFVCRSVDHLIKDCNFHAKPKSQPIPRNNAHRGYNKQHASFTKKFLQKHIVPAALLPKSKPVSVTVVRPICADVPKNMMTRPKHAHSINTKSKSTFKRHKTCSQSLKTSSSSPKVTAAKAPVVSAAKGKKGKWVWRPKCPILDHDSRTTAKVNAASVYGYYC